jgi:putative mRNA 3-end processing factor
MNSITGLGACQEVGRSGFVLDFGEKFLLDYGIKLTPDGVDYPLDVREHVKAVIISHAHLDHSGLLPYYYKNSECISFMTQPTLELADILWKDSIKIAEFEGMAPKYTKQEIERTHRYNFIVPYNRPLHLSHDVSFEFFDAGHILGSALTKINCGEKSFLYTGDYKLEETQLHKGADMSMGHVDYVMIESTYGDRDHPNRKASEKAFCESVQDTVDRGGWAVVPVLALGRAQEIIDILAKYSITAPIFLDGMGKAVSEVYLRHSELIKDPKGLKRGLSSVIWVQGKNGRAKVMKRPCVIVTTSGMMKGGPVVGYVEKLMNDRQSKIHLTSFQAEGTPGRELMEKGVLPFGKSGQNVKIACKYEKYDFSAHPDQGEMIRSLKKWSPQEVFLVHGDRPVMDIFAKRIADETGLKAHILHTGKRVEFG